MSALAGLAAALLPPEQGGPEPERVAAAARALIGGMPVPARAGLGAALAGLEVASLARNRRTLRSARAPDRVAVLEGIAAAGIPGTLLVDALKTAVLMAWGAEEYAGEIAATGRAHEPARPDPALDLTPGHEAGDRLRCDALVIGSGAGGAFAARALARAGHEVLVVEEGERWTVERIRRTRALERFAGLYRDRGATFAAGLPPIALPIGRAVGGTTVVNSGTCYRPPAAVVRRWRDEHGLRLAADGLERRLADVEDTIGVAPVPADVMGRNGKLALAGAEALGWESGPLRRNAPGCRGACQCAIGCPNNAKAGVHLNALPQACEEGARVVSELRVERLVVEGGLAAGAVARTPEGREVRVDARVVVAAAGATETPALLRRSGLGGHPRLGRGLSIHPGVGVAGRFAEPVLAWHGVLQSAGVEELHEREGVLIEATSTPPGMGSMTLPGVGGELLGRLEAAEHQATLGAMIADAPAGRVVGARRPLPVYRLARRDRGRLRVALDAMARVLLAAGADEVELGGGLGGVRSEAELAPALERLDVRRLHLAAFHPTGTAAAGADPARHPVEPDGALRGARSVWVADASILPSCPTVNPQLSIMALAAGVGEAAAA